MCRAARRRARGRSVASAAARFLDGIDPRAVGVIHDVGNMVRAGRKVAPRPAMIEILMKVGWSMPSRSSKFACMVRAVAGRVPLRVFYLLAGLGLGAVWAFQDVPLWEHALRLALILVVAPPVIHLVRSQLATDRERPPGARLSLVRFSIAKALLVVVALIGTVLLDQVISRPELVVGLALAAIVTTLGPRLHRRMLVSSYAAVPNSQD
jgi:hypothetical protein